MEFKFKCIDTITGEIVEACTKQILLEAMQDRIYWYEHDYGYTVQVWFAKGVYHLVGIDTRVDY